MLERREALDIIQNFRDYNIDKQAERVHIEAIETFARKLPKVPKYGEREKAQRAEVRRNDLREIAVCEAAQSKNVIVFEDVIVQDPVSGAILADLNMTVASTSVKEIIGKKPFHITFEFDEGQIRMIKTIGKYEERMQASGVPEDEEEKRSVGVQVNENEIYLYGKKDEEEYRMASSGIVEEKKYQLEVMDRPEGNEDLNKTIYSDISGVSRRSRRNSEESGSGKSDATVVSEVRRMTGKGRETISASRTNTVLMTKEQVSVSRIEKVTIRKDNIGETNEWDTLVREVITANQAGPSRITGLITTPRRAAQMSKKRIHDIYEREEDASDEEMPLNIRRRQSRHYKRVPAEKNSENR